MKTFKIFLGRVRDGREIYNSAPLMRGREINYSAVPALLSPQKIKRRERAMKIIGVDVSKNFIIAFDGKSYHRIDNKSLDLLPQIVKKGDLVVMEQTGAYGVRYAQIFTSLGAEVFFADGKEFKAFRHGQIRKKSDYLDAKFLREFFLKKRKHCYPFNPQMIYTRALVRQHIRNKKDIVMHMNRLKQYLAIVFPEKEYYDLPKDKLIKSLAKIEEELKNSIHPFTDLALMELQKLKKANEALQRIEEELSSIARNHPDYEILKTFPHLSDITIATLIAYYWDIDRFGNVDAFIGYVLMGVKYEQSGKWESMKTDKARTEIKGNFYMVFMQAHRKDSPLNPLTELVKQLSGGRGNYKRRYIKFLDFLFRIIFIALKERLPFTEALKRRIENIQKDFNLKELRNPFSYEIVNINRSLIIHHEILKRVECQDISSDEKRSVKFISTRKNNQKEGSGDESTQPEDNEVPPFIRRKNLPDNQNPTPKPPPFHPPQEDHEIPF